MYAPYALAPSAFPCLQKLYTCRNLELMDDIAKVCHFVREVLMAPGSVLEELAIGYCWTTHAAGLETHPTLLLLGIYAEGLP